MIDRRPRRLPLLAWGTPLFCHLPGEGPFRAEALADASEGGDRWNEPGEPTAYLASDSGVALAELARHYDPAVDSTERRIVRLVLPLEGITGLVDLRDGAVRRELGVEDGSTVFLDRELSRSLAGGLRTDARHVGLIVPSMAFLDQPERCNVVLFADRVPGGMADLVRSWDEVLRLR